MNPNAPRIRTIFLAAVENEEPERWQEYLDEQCAGDADMRRQVEILLKAHLEPNNLLDAPPVTVEMSKDRPGTTIGRYQLLEEIGEGGMGTVWMAQQSEPVKRLVAVKLIKAGMDSKQVIARFEAERQALALMDHVNIARVIDGGTTGAGRPYFVMDLVKGVPVTNFCDDRRLTTRQRLELFIPICHAVQHAHQKGIIHRDLKPSNVLVALHDDKPVPKVIDFGVAKATGQSLTEKTLVTGLGNIVGTLEYMSPEQADVNQLDIDTRSDIYSLGVLLYELLTGSPPFTRKELEKGSMLEMLRVIREQEPSKPSTKLSTADGLPTLAANRGTDPGKLTKLVRGELDWIVMKALEKDRSRRYETASAFAADVQRYLRDEPVEASPPSRWYRFRKFARRNKAALVTVSMMTLALFSTVAVLAVSNWMITQEKDEKEKALDNALTEKKRADKNLALARKAVKDYHARTASNRLLKEADFSELRRELLESAIPFYVEFVKQKVDDPVLEAERGRAYVELANLRQEMAENEQSLVDFAEGCAIWERLVAKDPENPGYQHELAMSYRLRGNLHRQLGQLAKAETSYRQGLKLMESLDSAYPGEGPYRQDLGGDCFTLGSFLKGLGRLEDAEPLFKKAVDVFERQVVDFPETAEYRNNLAQSHASLAGLFQVKGRHKDALKSLQRAEDISQKLCEEFSTKADFRETWSDILNNKSVLLGELNRHKEAMATLEKALRIQKELADDFASLPSYRKDEAASHVNLSALLSDVGRHNEALKHGNAAVDILDRLPARSRGVPGHRHTLALAHINRGRALGGLQQYEEALTPYQKARALLEKLDADAPKVVNYRRDLAMIYNNLGDNFNRLRRHDDAVAILKKGLPIREQLVAEFPGVPVYDVDLAHVHLNMGIGFTAKGQPEAALEWFEKGLAQVERYLVHKPPLSQAQQVACRCHAARANVLHIFGLYPQALNEFDRALALDDGQLRSMIQPQRAETQALLNPHVPPVLLAVGKALQGQLTRDDPVDFFLMTPKSHHKVHAASLEPGQPYLIDLRGNFDTFLRVEDSQKKTLLFNDDVRPDDLSSRLVFIPPRKDSYRLVVTTFEPGATGSFKLSIQKAVKKGEPTLLKDRLRKTDKQDREGKYYKLHEIKLAGGSPYTIELASEDFDTFLVLLDGDGQILNDDIVPGNRRLSRLDFTPRADAEFAIAVTSREREEAGAYTLTIQRYEEVKEK